MLFARRYDIIIKLIAAQTEYGRLAQLVEHLLDVQEVTGSSPVPSTTKILRLSSEDFLFGGGTGLEQGGSDDASRQSKQSAQWAVA